MSASRAPDTGDAAIDGPAADGPVAPPAPPPGWQAWPPPGARGHTVTGAVYRRADLPGPRADDRRDLFVWLPPSYDARPGHRYPVLYMHDGQNLFDRATGFGGEEWGVDETMQAIAADGVEAIVVGVPNLGAERAHEYSPWTDPRIGGGRGDAYLAFLLETVRPAVDAAFRTRTDREHTGIAGSSMGGLISLYAFFHPSAAFGFAGLLSPSLWFAGRAALAFVRDQPYRPGRLYIDIGTREGSVQLLDVARLREMLIEKGYRKGTDLLTVVEQGGRHNEAAWSRRFRRAARFLLGQPDAESLPTPRPDARTRAARRTRRPRR
jgi:predicted alpha/beta superfamily hydrolase